MIVQVNLNNDLVSKIDIVTKEIGLSRSAFCAIMIAQGFIHRLELCNSIEGLIINEKK